MTALDVLISEAARDGRFTGLTLYRTQDGRWQASTTTDRVSWSITIDTAPDAALRGALGGRAQEPAGDLFG